MDLERVSVEVEKVTGRKVYIQECYDEPKPIWYHTIDISKSWEWKTLFFKLDENRTENKLIDMIIKDLM